MLIGCRQDGEAGERMGRWEALLDAAETDPSSSAAVEDNFDVGGGGKRPIVFDKVN